LIAIIYFNLLFKFIRHAGEFKWPTHSISGKIIPKQTRSHDPRFLEDIQRHWFFNFTQPVTWALSTYSYVGVSLCMRVQLRLEFFLNFFFFRLSYYHLIFTLFWIKLLKQNVKRVFFFIILIMNFFFELFLFAFYIYIYI
jgi:hypothetical protein